MAPRRSGGMLERMRTTATSLVALLAWDATVAAPTPRDAAEDEESGRGLAIVAGLSAACGYYYPANQAGKVTWALIDTP